MWCSTECWDCEDKTCEHYKSKLDLYFENKKLINNWNELEEWLQNEYNEWSEVDDDIIRAEARQCIEVLDKMKEIKENNK